MEQLEVSPVSTRVMCLNAPHLKSMAVYEALAKALGCNYNHHQLQVISCYTTIKLPMPRVMRIRGHASHAHSINEAPMFNTIIQMGTYLVFYLGDWSNIEDCCLVINGIEKVQKKSSASKVILRRILTNREETKHSDENVLINISDAKQGRNILPVSSTIDIYSNEEESNVVQSLQQECNVNNEWQNISTQKNETTRNSKLVSHFEDLCIQKNKHIGKITKKQQFEIEKLPVRESNYKQKHSIHVGNEGIEKICKQCTIENNCLTESHIPVYTNKFITRSDEQIHSVFNKRDEKVNSLNDETVAMKNYTSNLLEYNHTLTAGENLVSNEVSNIICISQEKYRKVSEIKLALEELSIQSEQANPMIYNSKLSGINPSNLPTINSLWDKGTIQTTRSNCVSNQNITQRNTQKPLVTNLFYNKTDENMFNINCNTNKLIREQALPVTLPVTISNKYYPTRKKNKSFEELNLHSNETTLFDQNACMVTSLNKTKLTTSYQNIINDKNDASFQQSSQSVNTKNQTFIQSGTINIDNHDWLSKETYDNVNTETVMQNNFDLENNLSKSPSIILNLEDTEEITSILDDEDEEEDDFDNDLCKVVRRRLSVNITGLVNPIPSSDQLLVLLLSPAEDNQAWQFLSTHLMIIQNGNNRGIDDGTLSKKKTLTRTKPLCVSKKGISISTYTI